MHLETLGITASRLKGLGLVDRIVNEPVGGAHRDPGQMALSLKRAIADSLRQFAGMRTGELIKQRQARLMNYGKFKELAA